MHRLDALLENFVILHKSGAEAKGLELLSSKGKILATMLRHDSLQVKDIPSLSGVSFRTCFEHLGFFEQIGIIEKRNDPLDKRRYLVKVNVEKLSNTINND
jgi:DNA-binding MarR family transcriptional regulator